MACEPGVDREVYMKGFTFEMILFSGASWGEETVPNYSGKRTDRRETDGSQRDDVSCCREASYSGRVIGETRTR